jgi:hypothetical protein
MMAARKNVVELPDMPMRRAATNPDDREKQLINDAYDMAEEQIRNRTASSQVVTHFLKAGSSREGIEKQKLLKDLEVADAKIAQMQQSARLEELLGAAIEAMRSYSPVGHAEGLESIQLSDDEFDVG